MLVIKPILLLMATRNPAVTNQLRLVVDIPLFTTGSLDPKRWLAGFLNQQQ